MPTDQPNTAAGEAGVPWHSPLGGLQEARRIAQRAYRDVEAAKAINGHIAGNPYDVALSALNSILSELGTLVAAAPPPPANIGADSPMVREKAEAYDQLCEVLVGKTGQSAILEAERLRGLEAGTLSAQAQRIEQRREEHDARLADARASIARGGRPSVNRFSLSGSPANPVAPSPDHLVAETREKALREAAAVALERDEDGCTIWADGHEIHDAILELLATQAETPE